MLLGSTQVYTMHTTKMKAIGDLELPYWAFVGQALAYPCSWAQTDVIQSTMSSSPDVASILMLATDTSSSTKKTRHI